MASNIPIDGSLPPVVQLLFEEYAPTLQGIRNMRPFYDVVADRHHYRGDFDGGRVMSLVDVNTEDLDLPYAKFREKYKLT
jgi:hypothetical protein